ncbi:MAG: cupin domain-containing protein [Candidatus Latescibacteria bacterium]|nr:cupin domain-containing protein [Candidatus Latescibacterota bacterium]
MRVARADRQDMDELSSVHGGAGAILFGRLWERADFETPFAFVHTAILLPDTGIGYHRHDDSEEIFITTDNAAQFTHNGRTAIVEGGAAVPLRTGEIHAIYNHTDQDTRWFNVHCVVPGGTPKSADMGDDRSSADLESTERLPVGRLDRASLSRTQIHGGKGEVGHRMIWGPEDFRSNFHGLTHDVLPPGTSIGYHRHEGVEECYIVVEGSGRMTVDDETQVVQQGDTIPSSLGGSHGLYNHTQEDLEVLVVSVSAQKGQFDATDLEDDLSQR